MLEIRPARPGDVGAMVAMIGELAAFEQLGEQAVGRPADLERHLFGPTPFAHALVAEWDGAPVAFALYFFSYSTFLCQPSLYLEDLYVRPAHRGQRVGLALLEALEARARECGCGRFEWSVLDWNERAIRFYEQFGARPVQGWTIYRKALS